MHYISRIESLGACPEALRWLRAARHPDLDAAWAACPRADWLLWIAALLAEPGSPEHRAVVAAAADCAAAVEDLAPDASAAAVETARRLARGEASVEECRAAAAAAAWSAARAGAWAAYAACHAASAAEAAYAAADAAAAAGRSVDFAAIVRRHIPAPPTLPEMR